MIRPPAVTKSDSTYPGCDIPTHQTHLRSPQNHYKLLHRAHTQNCWRSKWNLYKVYIKIPCYTHCIEYWIECFVDVQQWLLQMVRSGHPPLSMPRWTPEAVSECEFHHVAYSQCSVMRWSFGKEIVVQLAARDDNLCLSVVGCGPSSSLYTGCVVSLRGDWANFCHTGSGRIGRASSAGEKSLKILPHYWELNTDHGEVSKIHLFSHWAITIDRVRSSVGSCPPLLVSPFR